MSRHPFNDSILVTKTQYVQYVFIFLIHVYELSIVKLLEFLRPSQGTPDADGRLFTISDVSAWHRTVSISWYPSASSLPDNDARYL